MSRVFVNGPGDLGSIPGHVIPKTLEMVLDTSLLYTQQYKVRIKGKVEQSWVRSSALHLGVVAIEKGSLLVALNYSHQLLLLTMYTKFQYLKTKYFHWWIQYVISENGKTFVFTQPLCTNSMWHKVNF